MIRAIDRAIDWVGDIPILEPLGHSHRPVIVVFVDRRASSLDGVSLGSSDGAGRGDVNSVVADSMGATAALTVREGGKLAGFVHEVVVG